MTLWSAAAVAQATAGTATTDWIASGVSIDTRTLRPGDLFVALKAARDGHDFVADALAMGAAAALVSHVPDGVSKDAPLLIVDDVLAGLEALGVAARARTEARVVAVTGSVGKTSTKEMLRAMLGDQGRTHASVASYNNHWGVPLTLARMPADTEYAVIEIGMNHPSEISPLARMVRPHVAMITTVAAAHLAAFDNIAAIAVEKASIIDGLEYGGTAILNNDCETAAILQAKAHDAKRRDVGFGEHGFDFVLKTVDLQENTTIVQAEANGTPLLFKIGAVGKHYAMNGLGALAAVEAVGGDLALAVQSLGRWSSYQGRGAREVIYLDPFETHLTLELIDDSYNANPASMQAAFEVLAAANVTSDTGRVSKGRRICFVGDMKELGDEADALHADLAVHPAMQHIDTVHCVGALMQSLRKALPAQKQGVWTQDASEMAGQVRRLLDSGDVVLVKGSLSMKLALVVDAIRKMGHPVDLGIDPQNKSRDS